MPSCMSISSSLGPSPPGCRAVPEMLPTSSCCCCCLLQALQEAIWTKWGGYLQQYLELPGRAWRSGPGAADLEQYLDLKQYTLELAGPWEGDSDLQQYPLRRGLGVGEALELARPWERRGVGLALATGGWPWREATLAIRSKQQRRLGWRGSARRGRRRQ